MLLQDRNVAFTFVSSWPIPTVGSMATCGRPDELIACYLSPLLAANFVKICLTLGTSR